MACRPDITRTAVGDPRTGGHSYTYEHSPHFDPLMWGSRVEALVSQTDKEDQEMQKLLANKGTEGWLVRAPAFSITKVQVTAGALISAILGAVPPTLTDDRSVVIAAIAAGTLILLGVLALVAVDVRTRQRAEEAQLRYGDATPAAPADVLASPAERLRVMRGASDEEYVVDVVKVTDGAVSLIATRNGHTVGVGFNTPTIGDQ